jgi:hypothetical protein
MNNDTTKAVGRARFMALAVTGIMATALYTAGAHAEPKSLPIHGTLASHAVSGPSCTSPTGLCFVGETKGSLHGPAEFLVEAVTPTATPDVSIVSGSLTIHDSLGDVFCHEEAVLNTSASGDGEFAFLCEITGGTGKWAGASGYIQSVGTVPPSTGQGVGDYTGAIILP